MNIYLWKRGLLTAIFKGIINKRSFRPKAEKVDKFLKNK